MSRKRRLFDIEVPEADIPEDIETKSMIPRRRGPMATAIGNTADSLRTRAQIEADIRAENDALAHEFVRLKKLGLIVDLIPLDAIRTRKLQRDRRRSSDLALEDLKASIQDIGLSNPIRVEPIGDGEYELVQGLRRLTAYRELLDETDEDRWSAIPAGILPGGESDAALYRRMVDENLVRKGVSFAEMAQLARYYAEDRVDGCEDVDEAVNHLYAAASPQKRSYVRRFAHLMSMLEKVLSTPELIPRSVGLAVMDRIEGDPDARADLVARLRAVGEGDQIAVLRSFLAERRDPVAEKTRGAPRRSKGRVALSVPVGGGIRCTAADGKIEMRARRDFSNIDRGRLEAAIEAFFREIGEE